MSDRVFAALFVVGIWWLSTAVVLKTVWLGRKWARASVVVASALAVSAVFGLAWSQHLASSVGAYLAFGCAIAIWGWHELTFLLGLITGPRKLPCPPGVVGWRRFVVATSVVIHHEIALAATLLVMIALAWGKPNQVGVETFAVLWVMRLSAKLNVFLGVRNISEQFVPEHLRYMITYFRRARLNPLMPLSLIGAAVGMVLLLLASRDVSSFAAVEHVLVGTLLALAFIEHVFLAVKLPDASLWSWTIRKQVRPS